MVTDSTAFWLSPQHRESFSTLLQLYPFRMGEEPAETGPWQPALCLLLESVRSHSTNPGPQNSRPNESELPSCPRSVLLRSGAASPHEYPQAWAWGVYLQLVRGTGVSGQSRGCQTRSTNHRLKIGSPNGITFHPRILRISNLNLAFWAVMKVYLVRQDDKTYFIEQFSALGCNLIMETEEMWVSFCVLSPAHRFT